MSLNREIAPMVADELKRYMPDLVEVVRCKDCYHYSIVNQPYDEVWCSVMEDSVPTDGYCYHGRRREATECEK